MNFLSSALFEPFFKPKDYAKGFLLTFLILSISYALSYIIPLGAVAICIILGICLTNICTIKDEYKKGLKYASTTILGFSIALMGINLNFGVISQLGFSLIFIIIFTMAVAIISTILLAKLFKIDSHLSVLLGVGNGVCGSAAISAISPIIKAKEQDVATSIAVVNFLGVIALFAFPVLLSNHISELLFGVTFSDLNAAVVIGNTIQAVGQASGAGFSVNDEVGVLATTVKMGRVLMLTPLVLLIVFIVAYANAKNKQVNSANNTSNNVSVPTFIIFFIIFSAISSFEVLPKQAVDTISNISHFALVFAMSALALGIHFNSIKDNALKALALASVVFCIQISITLVWIFA